MTADDIRSATLVPVKKLGRNVGYDLDSVDVLLEQVAVAIEEKDASIEELKERLSKSQAELDVAKDSLNDYDTALGRVKNRVVELEEQLHDAEKRLANKPDAFLANDLTNTLGLDEPEFDEPEPEEPKLEEPSVPLPPDTDPSEARRLLASKETIANAIIDAQLAADDILRRAEAQAETILEQAEAQGTAIIDEYKAERDQINDEISRLVESKDSLRADYREMLQRYATPLDYDIGTSVDVEGTNQDLIEQVNAGIDAHTERIVKGFHSVH